VERVEGYLLMVAPGTYNVERNGATPEWEAPLGRLNIEFGASGPGPQIEIRIFDFQRLGVSATGTYAKNGSTFSAGGGLVASDKRTSVRSETRTTGTTASKKGIGPKS